MFEKKDKNEMSLPEKSICRGLLGKLPELAYPMIDVMCSDGVVQKEYVIPAADKEDVLKELYPFAPLPGIDDTMFDIHEEKEFVVRDFKVIRWEGTNIIASPYHAKSGGMLIDWVFPEETGKKGTYAERAVDNKFKPEIPCVYVVKSPNKSKEIEF